MLTRLALPIALACLLLPATANATFPGANGRIVLERSARTSATRSILTVLPSGLRPRFVYSSTDTRSVDGMRFSPNGARLLFNESARTATGSIDRIVRLSSAGGSRVVLESGTADVGRTAPYRATWSRTGGVYFARTTGFSFTDLVGPAGVVARTYESDAVSCACPLEFAISPDGTQAVYLRIVERTDPETQNRIVEEDLWIVDLDGTDARRLTTFGDLSPGSEPFTMLRWGAGGLIYFTAVPPGAEQDGSWSWYRIRPDGGELARIDAFDLQPSPDGRLLAVQGRTGALFRTDRYGRNRLRLASSASNPVFSPDSRRIAFGAYVRSSRGQQLDVFSIGVNGRGRVRVTNTASTNELPLDWAALRVS